ncbi:MAG: hypothetical protein ACYTBX_04385 [Planctomycetota bacterium]|jgi:hypothetical protein
MLAGLAADVNDRIVWSFLSFHGDAVVPERNLLVKGHVGTGRCPGSLERTLRDFG